MSFKHLQNVIDEKDIPKEQRMKGGTKAVLIVLAYRANDAGECWPSYSRIANDAGVDRATVARILPRLEAAGKLVIAQCGKAVHTAHGPQLVNLYRLPEPSRTTRPPPPADVVAPCSEPSRTTRHNVVAPRAGGSRTTRPELKWKSKQQLKPNLKPNSKPGGGVSCDSIPSL